MKYIILLAILLFSFSLSAQVFNENTEGEKLNYKLRIQVKEFDQKSGDAVLVQYEFSENKEGKETVKEKTKKVTLNQVDLMFIGMVDPKEINKLLVMKRNYL